MRPRLLLAGAALFLLAACSRTPDDVAVRAPLPVPEPSPGAALDAAPIFDLARFPSTPRFCSAGQGRDWAAVALQVEMMVTALTCGPRYGIPDAYPRYRATMNLNSPTIRAATERVAAQLGFGGSGIARFDQEQTYLSNSLSLTAGGAKAAAFCAPREAWFKALLNATPSEFARHADAVGERLCPAAEPLRRAAY